MRVIKAIWLSYSTKSPAPKICHPRHDFLVHFLIVLCECIISKLKMKKHLPPLTPPLDVIGFKH